MERKDEAVEIKHIRDVAGAEPGEEIIPGLLDKGLVLVVSREGVGKTFLGIHMGAHIATGAFWGGKPVKKGVVIYCIAEGVSFFPWRVTTAFDHLEPRFKAGRSPFYILDKPLNVRCKPDGDPSDDMVKLADAIAAIVGREGLDCRMIVFDTLNRFMPGGDENDQKDATALVAGCGWIQRQFGCAVVMMHHMRKEGDMVRGSTVLTAGMDQVLISQSEKDDNVTVWTTKGVGKRKDRDGIEVCLEKIPVPMTDGNMLDEYLDEEFEIEDHIYKMHQDEEDKGKPDSHIPVEFTLYLKHVSKEEANLESSPLMNEIMVFLESVGEAGVTLIMRHTGKAQKTVYNAMDRLVESGKVLYDKERKKWSVNGGGVSPFGG